MFHKFEDAEAEVLYASTMDAMEDGNLGDATDFGWYALFLEEKCIIKEDVYGFVSYVQYNTERETAEAWFALEESWEEFLDDENMVAEMYEQEEEAYGFGWPDEDDLYDMED